MSCVFFKIMLKLELDLETTAVWAIVALVVVILALLFWDVHYFLRTAFHLLYGKFFERRASPSDTTTIYGICSTTDLDIMFMHMNNARYIRELDFARFHYYERTGLYNEIRAVNGNVFQTATHIKYRRSIPLFMTYKITTKLIYWDDKSLYLEQQFISLKDNFVRAVALTKQATIGVTITDVMAKLLKKDKEYRPIPPPELEHFLNCLEASSVRLRAKEE